MCGDVRDIWGVWGCGGVVVCGVSGGCEDLG